MMIIEQLNINSLWNKLEALVQQVTLKILPLFSETKLESNFFPAGQF